MSAKNDLPNMLSKVAKDRNFLEITTKRHNDNRQWRTLLHGSGEFRI